MSDVSAKEIELYKKLTAREVADQAFADIKSRFWAFTLGASILSGLGTGTAAYSVMNDTIGKAQAENAKAIAQTSALAEEIKKRLQTMQLTEQDIDTKQSKSQETLRRAQADWDKLQTVVDKLQPQIEANRAQLESSRSQLNTLQTSLTSFQAKSAAAIQSNLEAQKLSTPSSSGAPSPAVANLKQALDKSATDVAQLQTAVANSRYKIFVHVASDASSAVLNSEKKIQDWLATSGYSVGGVTKDGSGAPRVDYFSDDDAATATAIANYIRTNFEAFPEIIAKKKTVQPGQPNYIGLWL